MVSHLGTQSLLKLSLTWAHTVQYNYVANFGILHTMLVFWSAECKKYGVTEACMEISKDILGGQAVHNKTRISAHSHWEVKM
jgi:hypothetical protein